MSDTKIIRKKTLTGTVVGNKSDKTAVVKAEVMVIDRTYKKFVRQSKKYHVHDEKNELNLGETVTIIETRPMSRLKRWRVHKIG